MVYSTCSLSPLQNEEVSSEFVHVITIVIGSS
jgi:16S rRNA C967 or C1407 C5-methylase (RsmB/RsmF family)